MKRHPQETFLKISLLVLCIIGISIAASGADQRMSAVDTQALVLAIDHYKGCSHTIHSNGSVEKGVKPGKLDAEAETLRGILEQPEYGFASVLVSCPEQRAYVLQIEQCAKYLEPLLINPPVRLALVYFVFRGIADEAFSIIPGLCQIMHRIDSPKQVLIIDVESHSKKASETIDTLHAANTAVFCSAFNWKKIAARLPKGGNLITTQALSLGLAGAADTNGDGDIAVKELFGFLEKTCNSFLRDPKDGSCAWTVSEDFPVAKSPEGVHLATESEHTPGRFAIYAGLDFVWAPPGVFFMGSAPISAKRNTEPFVDGGCAWHPVQLTKGFWMQQTEVSKEQWKTVMGTEPWKGKTFVSEDDKTPAVFVSWEDAQAFVERLNAKGEGHFRLPTDAEWEWACQAGSSMIPLFLSKEEFDAQVWYSGNAREAGEPYAHPYGQKQGNAWDLQDMLGNVWEWCSDFSSSHETGLARDPQGPATGNMRVLRGRSWFDRQPSLTNPESSWSRCGYRPDFRACMVGFRVCRDP